MLGINKTSESPPALRRELQGNNNWNTLDHRMRHSTNASPLYSDSFQRDNVYRSSLQHIPAGNVNVNILFPNHYPTCLLLIINIFFLHVGSYWL